MSQETTSTATSSNLEAQLADAMTAINALTTNMGALFNQVNTLTNSIGVMQAAQAAYTLPPPPVASSQPHPNNTHLPITYLFPHPHITNNYHTRPRLFWPRTNKPQH
jgi:hypothetical protein